MRRDQARAAALLELKRLVAEGIASGPGVPVDRAALKVEARARLGAKRSS